MTTVLVTGNTYPVKDELKKLGAKWNPDMKGWMVPVAKSEEAQELVRSGAPNGASSSSGSSGSRPQSSYRPTRCKQCGARPGPRGWPRIYKNGVCSDCYRDAYDE